jgi:probable lipoprotein NlpC
MKRKFNQISLSAVLNLLVSIALCSCSSLNVSKNHAKADILISEARTYLGVPYKWGGLSRQGLDCSGLVFRSFEKAGINLPRTTEGLVETGRKVKLKKTQPGDLLFFALSDKPGKVTHVGIVTKKINGRLPDFIHASTSKGVIESSLELKYYKEALRGVRRAVN